MQHRSFLLELTPETFRASARCDMLGLRRAAAGEHALCSELWREVGRGFWTERARWNPERWRRRLADPSVSFWIASRLADDAGCFELSVRRRGVKMEGFGLLPPWRGNQLGGELLSAATRLALASGARRVWLHTATDDHPHALPNYLARGYRVVRERALRKPILR